MRQPDQIPMSRAELKRLGWDGLDVLIVTGDAHVDHPAFAAALLARWLIHHDFKTGIVAQPRWDRPDDVAALGRPRLFVGVTAGALDSMVAHYTAFRKKRHDDPYAPGGVAGLRPNRAAIVYAGLVKQAFPGLPVALGGIEASLRRVSHYDFWTDQVRRSALLDAKADLLVYGMGERAILKIARRLAAPGTADVKARLEGVAGTVFAAETGRDPIPPDAARLELPSHEEIVADPSRLIEATLRLERQVHHGDHWLTQQSGGRRVVVTPPAAPLKSGKMDELYGLPFTRRAHPSYHEPIPALEPVQFGVTSHRGCGGGCAFCSLTLHQGRRASSRSAASILAEVLALTQHPDFHGAIVDVGGPTANFWGAVCKVDPAACLRPSCLTPELCPQLHDEQAGLARLLDQIAAVPGVTSVRVASGVRHDLALRCPDYISALVRRFTGGQLKIAPEHLTNRVLRLMRKPAFSQFERFLERFERESRAAGKRQFIVPYLVSAFPGCRDDDMRELAEWLSSRGWKPRQVQCFVPTPGTMATAMYHAGLGPNLKPITVARSDADRLRQHAILTEGLDDPEAARRSGPPGQRRGRSRQRPT